MAITRIILELMGIVTPGLLPLFRNIERPFELQVGMVIIVDEFGDCIIVASSHHAARCFVGIDYPSCQPCFPGPLLCDSYTSSHESASLQYSVDMSPATLHQPYLFTRAQQHLQSSPHPC